jgi:FAD:protein FMN transferase
MRKLIIVLFVVVSIFITGCSDRSQTGYTRYQESYFDTFDTLVQFVAYTESEEEFNGYAEKFHERLKELHRLYDIYITYEGVNNLKTINDRAGIEPVKVDQEIIDLILFSREWSEKTGGAVNIALGPVLSIWHSYREEALFDPANAELPPMEKLREAMEYTDLDQVIVDTMQMTVYLPYPQMSLDVGAVAKGYALQIAIKELEEAGLHSAIVSAGGNIHIVGSPRDGERDRWGVGIQDPQASIVGGQETLLDVIYLDRGSVDTSGDYQRYYIVEGELIHHLIDSVTLMPATHYRAVTVVAEDSGLADFMSTALFLIPFEESKTLAESLDNFEAIWVMPDGEVRTTEGMKPLLRSNGATAR